MVNDHRWTAGELLAYGGPAMIIAMLTMSLIVYVPAFYATEVGLSLSSVGVVFLLARTWDAVIDPLVGHLSDQTRSRFGPRKPWILAGTPILLAATYMLFQPPSGVGAAYLVVWIGVFYLAWTMVQIPYLSWGADLSDDYDERSRIVGYREGMLFVGTILATLVPLLVFRDSNPTIRQILTVFVYAAIFVLPITVLFALKRIPAGQQHHQVKLTIKESVIAVRKNRPFFVLLLATFLAWLALHIYNATVLLIIEYAMQLPRSEFLRLVFVQFVVGLVTVPLMIRLANRFGKHRVLGISLVGVAISLPILALVPPGNLTAAVAVFALLGITISPTWVLPTAIVADVVDHGRLAGGGDQAGIYMAIYNLGVKIALAASVGIALPLIEWGGFDPASASGAMITTPLLAVGLFLPGLINLPAAWFLWRFPIDKVAQRRLQEALSEGSA